MLGLSFCVTWWLSGGEQWLPLWRGHCPFQLSPVPIIFHCFKNPRWSGKKPFFLWVCSYVSSTTIIDIWSISIVLPLSVVFFFLCPWGALLINITCPASTGIWVWDCWFWCVYHHSQEFYSWLSTEDPIIASPSSFLSFSFKKERQMLMHIEHLPSPRLRTSFEVWAPFLASMSFTSFCKYPVS